MRAGQDDFEGSDEGEPKVRCVHAASSGRHLETSRRRRLHSFVCMKRQLRFGVESMLRKSLWHVKYRVAVREAWASKAGAGRSVALTIPDQTVKRRHTRIDKLDPDLIGAIYVARGMEPLNSLFGSFEMVHAHLRLTRSFDLIREYHCSTTTEDAIIRVCFNYLRMNDPCRDIPPDVGAGVANPDSPGGSTRTRLPCNCRELFSRLHQIEDTYYWQFGK